MVRHRADMPLRPTRRDDQVIGDGGSAADVDRDDVFGFVIFERRDDQFCGGFRGEFRWRFYDGFGAGGGLLGRRAPADGRLA
jgi:hypothetical protein